jgi:hypothetical protein
MAVRSSRIRVCETWRQRELRSTRLEALSTRFQLSPGMDQVQRQWRGEFTVDGRVADGSLGFGARYAGA